MFVQLLFLFLTKKSRSVIPKYVLATFHHTTSISIYNIDSYILQKNPSYTYGLVCPISTTSFICLFLILY